MAKGTKSNSAGSETSERPEDEVMVTRSSGNVFADLGFANPEEELAKAKLVNALAAVIEEKGLTQARVADLLGVDQPTVSKLLRGRTGGFTSDRLMRLLNLLGLDVDISIRPKQAQVARVNISLARLM